MTIKDIITALLDEHQKLIAIAEEKTESIKTNNIDALSKLLMKERKQVQIITQLEDKRQKAVELYFQEKNQSNQEKTISNLLELMDDDEKELEQKVLKLVEEIVKLKQVEQLNQELIEQSMAFVQLSLDMLQPSEKNRNYTETPNGEQHDHRSVFDSRA